MTVEGVRIIVATNPSPMTLDGTRTYIVGESRPVVIDPGPDLDEHVEAVLVALGGIQPEAIVVTHSHADHSGAATTLAARTGARVLMREHPHQRSVVPSASLAPVSGAECIETDSGALELIATPGHAPDHLAVHWYGAGAPAGGAIFAGDLLMGEGDTTLVAPPEGNLRDYLESLCRLEGLRPEMIFPAHGPPLRDGVDAIRRHRRHREERLDQVRRLLQERPRAATSEIVHLVYGAGLDPALRQAAAGSVRAMLEYLLTPSSARTRGRPS